MIHPSGLQTTDYEPSELFEPNGLQIESAARRAQRDDRYIPRRHISPVKWFIGTIGLLCLAYAGTYFVLSKVLG